MKVIGYDKTTIKISYFCSDEAKAGTVVEYVPDKELERDGIYKVKPGQNNGEVVGVLLNDIVKIDLWNYREFPPYSFLSNRKIPGDKVEILQEGTIMIQFKNKKKINTLLFYNKKGKFTNKPQLNQKPVGVILSSDNDGWTKILFRCYGI